MSTIHIGEGAAFNRDKWLNPGKGVSEWAHWLEFKICSKSSLELKGQRVKPILKVFRTLLTRDTNKIYSAREIALTHDKALTGNQLTYSQLKFQTHLKLEITLETHKPLTIFSPKGCAHQHPLLAPKTMLSSSFLVPVQRLMITQVIMRPHRSKQE